jgi:hypothetical protein
MYVPTPHAIKGVLFTFPLFFTDNDDFADCPGGDYRNYDANTINKLALYTSMATLNPKPRLSEPHQFDIWF